MKWQSWSEQGKGQCRWDKQEAEQERKRETQDKAYSKKKKRNKKNILHNTLCSIYITAAFLFWAGGWVMVFEGEWTMPQSANYLDKWRTVKPEDWARRLVYQPTKGVNTEPL